MKLKLFSTIAAAASTALFSISAYAGPFILSGTDADDHGSATGSANLDGWLYMQKALENLASAVTVTNKVVVSLGSTSTAGSAASSAFNFSSLGGSGWTFVSLSTGNFGTFFGGTGLYNVNNVGLLMMDSGNNVIGGVDGSSFTAYAAAINNFVGSGGGLFSQANGYQWLTALLPSVTAPGESDTGISLTAAGNAAFPGLTNSDLSAGPYHQRFEGYGAIPVLGIGTASQSAIIIGASGGSITNPTGSTVPEPESVALIGLGLAALVASRRRKIMVS